jgi:opacity protein-like surface antigen
MSRSQAPIRRAGIALVALALAAPAAAQQLTDASKSPPSWRFEFTPYLWMADISGTISMGPTSTNVSADFGQILGNLTFAFMGTLEARHGRAGLLVDGIYLNVSETDTTAPTGFSSTDLRMKQQLYTLEATYRILKGRVPVDLVGGARYAWLNTDITLGGPPLPDRSQSATLDWWAGVIGARFQVPFNKWTLVGYGDYGGFNGDSNSQWQLIGGVTYSLSGVVVLKGAYRYLSLKYAKDFFALDAEYDGAAVGIGFRI